MSNEEQQRPATDAELKAVRDYFGALAGGLCPECGQPVEEEVQSGRCVYAKPCGHRMFEGKARKKGMVGV